VPPLYAAAQVPESFNLQQLSADRPENKQATALSNCRQYSSLLLAAPNFP
jgi:hypothetical protein